LETLELVKLLTEASGPVGFEHEIAGIVADLWRPWADEVRVDAMGSVIAVQHGSGSEPRRSVMAAAHMDEIGLIVTGLEGEFLRVHALGGVDRRVLLGLPVTVHGREDLYGVIGSRPPHVLPKAEQQNVLPWHETFIDLGLCTDEVKSLVRVGDPVTIRQPTIALKNGRVAGKAMDNRTSVGALTLALEALRHRDHVWDFYAVATVQEEVGVKGAITSAYGISPDLAIALDVTFAKQHGDGDPGTFDLGKGPTISVGPNFHPQMVKRLIEAAESDEIVFELEPVPGSSGTDAWGIQVAREGIPSGLIGIPVRYMHQPVETVALVDIERAGRLLASFVARLPQGYLPRWEDEV
jgi:putative aminopeptidase FrvX